VIPALPEEYEASANGIYHHSKVKRDILTSPEQPKGLAHYPSHVQAEARRMQDHRLPSQPIPGPSQSPPAQPQQQANGQQHVSVPIPIPLSNIDQALLNHNQSVARAAQAHPHSNSHSPHPPPGGVAPSYSNTRAQNSAAPEQPPGGQSQTPAAVVPNTFASIMNAFPAVNGGTGQPAAAPP
jgi:hypothetical protein